MHNQGMIKGYLLICLAINLEGLPVNRCAIASLPEQYGSVEQCFAAGQAIGEQIRSDAPDGVVVVVTIECNQGKGA